MTIPEKYAQVRSQLERDINGRTDLPDALKALLLETEYVRAVMEILNPELMQQPDWRLPGSYLVARVGAPGRLWESEAVMKA